MGKERGEGLTWSFSVAQCAWSINVTTRPGASGVPLWSSLCGGCQIKGKGFVCGECTLPEGGFSSGCLLRSRLSYLPEAADVAFDVAGNALIYGGFSITGVE